MPGGLHGDRNISGALDVWYISLALWMSGQTRTNGRRSHITPKRARPASIKHTYSYVSQLNPKKVGVENVIFACVRINLGDTRGHIVDKDYENLTVNC